MCSDLWKRCQKSTWCSENTFAQSFRRTWGDPGHHEFWQSGVMITELSSRSSRNSLPAPVLPPASPCPHTITPRTSTCPSKVDLTEMESFWCADRAQKHTKLHFSRALLLVSRWVYISLQIHRERKGDGKSIVHMVWGVWLGSTPQHRFQPGLMDVWCTLRALLCQRPTAFPPNLLPRLTIQKFPFLFDLATTSQGLHTSLSKIISITCFPSSLALKDHLFWISSTCPCHGLPPGRGNLHLSNSLLVFFTSISSILSKPLWG